MKNNIKNNFSNVFNSYEYLFSSIKGVFNPNEKVATKVAAISISKAKSSAKDSRNVLNDFYAIGNDMKVAISKYESNR
ncbi:hypothetical protein HB943_02320 [Listeria weihenstephanensis]|uniref:LXG domain-containing protein n=1 Tax=Listeria weihenstephanensis TaxID=1006155 RepID=A0A841Z0T9_9LIST|nr:hypothetical protein [Listeria weihenstephanensis]MBC1499421.1 hypothetical protein [Listeria weihenstephanensis]